jgi:hypothetical protein
MEHQFQIPVRQGADILIRPEKTEKTGGPAEGPMVFQYVVFLFQLNKNVTGKDRPGRFADYSSPPYVDLSPGRMEGQRNFGVQGPEKPDVFIFTSGFYLNGKVIHVTAYSSTIPAGISSSPLSFLRFHSLPG